MSAQHATGLEVSGIMRGMTDLEIKPPTKKRIAWIALAVLVVGAAAAVPYLIGWDPAPEPPPVRSYAEESRQAEAAQRATDTALEAGYQDAGCERVVRRVWICPSGGMSAAECREHLAGRINFDGFDGGAIAMWTCGGNNDGGDGGGI